jgi:ribosomal protein S11
VITYKNPNIYSGTTNGSFVKAYRNKSYNNTNTTYTGKSGTSSSTSTFGGLFKKYLHLVMEVVVLAQEAMTDL